MPGKAHDALTYAQIGLRLGISAGRVRQIEQKALFKLRAALIRLGVKSSLPPGSDS